MKRTIRIIIFVLLIAVFLYAGVKLAQTLLEYHAADEVYTNLQEEYLTEQAETEQVPIEIDFPALMERNRDIIGWLYCEGTPINYPVVQAEDNNRYLRRDLDGNYLVTGTLFADFRNFEIGVDRNFIIYGHNMKNESMFGTFVQYQDQAYYDAHPILYYLTPNGNYRIRLFSGMTVNEDDPIYQTNFENQSALLSRFERGSDFSASVTVRDTDQIVTLSTCSYDSDTARYVLLGVLEKLD